jgi:hypothetical protein
MKNIFDGKVRHLIKQLSKNNPFGYMLVRKDEISNKWLAVFNHNGSSMYILQESPSKISVKYDRNVKELNLANINNSKLAKYVIKEIKSFLKKINI